MSFPVLLTILLFGIWTSYTDIKKGVIKNYSILLLILTSIFVNIFLTEIFVTHTLTSGINLIMAITAGIILWLAGIWSAADAKLFIAFSFLLPMMFLSILVNSFVPLFLFLFLYVIIKTGFKEKREIFVELLKPRLILNIFLAVLALMCISYIISHVFKISVNYFLIVIIFFLIFWIVEQKFKLKLTYFFLAVTIVSAIFFHRLIFNLSFFLNWMIFSCIIFFIFFLMLLSRFVYSKPVKLNELKEGMIPAEIIFQKNQKYVKKPIQFLTLLTMLRERSSSKPIFGYNPDGVKSEDIQKVLNLYREKKLKFDEIRICKTMHFAPALFLGVLLTYFAKGSFIYLFF